MNLVDLPKDLPVPEDDGACSHLLGMSLPGVINVRKKQSFPDNHINLFRDGYYGGVHMCDATHINALRIRVSNHH